MLFRRTLSTLLFLFTISAIYGQMVKGIISNIKDGAIPYATVSALFNDTLLIDGTITSDQGYFELTKLEIGKTYLISVSRLGYERIQKTIQVEQAIMDIGDWQMEIASSELSTVEVVGQREMFEVRDDKLIVNVDSRLTKTSNDVSDVLSKSPGIMINGDNQLLLNGQTNVLILLNGRRQFASQKEAVQYLKSLPANQIKKIEIINQTSAAYSGSEEDGVINIILRRNENEGIKGSILGEASMGNYPRTNGSLNLSYQYKKINLYNTTQLGYREDQLDRIDDYSFLAQNFDLLKENRVLNKSDLIYNRLGIDYHLNKDHIIGLIVSGQIKNIDRNIQIQNEYQNADSVIDSLYLVNQNGEAKNDKLFINLNYYGTLDSAGKKLNIDFNYLKNVATNNSIFDHQYKNFTADPTVEDRYQLLNELPTDNQLLGTRMDLSIPINKKGKFSIGYKSTYVETINDIKYSLIRDNVMVTDKDRTGLFAYNEWLNIGYLNYQQRKGDYAFSFGLNYEYARTQTKQFGDSNPIRTFGGLTPTIIVRRKVGKNHMFGLKLNSVIARPDYIRVSSFEQYSSPDFSFEGDNDLKQHQIYIGTLRYTYKRKYSFMLRYDYSENYIPQNLFIATADGNGTIATYGNVARLQGFQFTASLPLKIVDWWQTYNSINSFYNFADSEEYPSLNYEVAYGFFSSTHVIELPAKIQSEFIFYGATKSRNNQIQYNPYFGIDVKFVRSFVNDDFKVTVFANDIFNQTNYTGFIEYGAIRNDFKNRQDLSRFGVKFNYLFGNRKVKKRNRSNGVEDAENRMKEQHVY